MTYRLFIVPDNGDANVQDFAHFNDAVSLAVRIIRDYEPAWPAGDIITQLKQGATLSYHDHSEIRIEQV